MGCGQKYWFSRGLDWTGKTGHMQSRIVIRPRIAEPAGMDGYLVRVWLYHVLADLPFLETRI